MYYRVFLGTLENVVLATLWGCFDEALGIAPAADEQLWWQAWGPSWGGGYGSMSVLTPKKWVFYSQQPVHMYFPHICKTHNPSSLWKGSQGQTEASKQEELDPTWGAHIGHESSVRPTEGGVAVPRVVAHISRTIAWQPAVMAPGLKWKFLLMARWLVGGLWLELLIAA